MAFDPSVVTSNFGFQDGFQTTLSAQIDANDTAIGLNILPTPVEGTLVIEPGTDNEEEIYFTSKGTGVVNCPDAASGRGVNGTAVAHASGVIVKMLVTKASLDVIKYLVGPTAMTLIGKIFKNPASTLQALTDGTNISWDCNNGEVATVTLGGNRTLNNPTNMKVGTYALIVTQDGSGNRTLDYGNKFKWANGTEATLSTAAGAEDIIVFVCDGTYMHGIISKNFSVPA